MSIQIDNAKDTVEASLKIIEDAYGAKLRYVRDAITEGKLNMAFKAFVKKDYMNERIQSYLVRKGYSVVKIDDYEYQINW